MNTKYLLVYRADMNKIGVTPIGVFDDIEAAKRFGVSRRVMTGFAIIQRGEWGDINGGDSCKMLVTVGIGLPPNAETVQGFLSISPVLYNPT